MKKEKKKGRVEGKKKGRNAGRKKGWMEGRKEERNKKCGQTRKKIRATA